MAAAWALGFMGVVGLIGAIGLFGQGWRARRGVIVTGAVVAVERSSTLETGPGPVRRIRYYAPVVEYADQYGTTHRVTASLSGKTQPEIGQQVQVSYRPEAPQRAIVLALPGQAAAKWVFLVVGLVCLGGAIAVAVNH